jgi:hypothetical protein
MPTRRRQPPPQKPPQSEDTTAWTKYLDDWQQSERSPEATLVRADLESLQKKQERRRRGKLPARPLRLWARARVVRATDPAEFVQRPEDRLSPSFTRWTYLVPARGNTAPDKDDHLIVVEGPEEVVGKAERVVLALEQVLQSATPLRVRPEDDWRAKWAIRRWIIAHIPQLRYHGRYQHFLGWPAAKCRTRRELVCEIARDYRLTTRSVNRAIAEFENRLKPSFNRELRRPRTPQA